MPHGKYMTRRALGALGAGALAGGAIGATADGGPGGLQLPKEAATALNRLREGLDRFIKGSSKHAHADINWRPQLVNSQKPFATILGCCDSRVPVELLFDQGFGDLFVIRVAGNVVAPDVIGSIDYAVDHLGTPLVLVLGHSNCGAVTAALDEMRRPVRSVEPASMESLLRLIEPGIPKSLLQVKGPIATERAVEMNVRWTVKQLNASPDLQEALRTDRLAVVGAVYNLEAGTLTFL